MRSLALPLLAGMLLLSRTALVHADETPLARGEYLTRLGNCQGCHTRPDGAPFAGGVAFETPFGRLYSSNITPDREHGLGDWTADEFRRALHEGLGREGEQLFPAFPYTAFTRLSDEDVAAIFAYLQVQRPVPYAPPANALRFPFDQRALIRGWKWLNFRQGPLPAVTDAQVARGAYLAEAVGHCQECHTPRTWSQGLDSGRAYAGATQQGWTAWNLTADPRGLGGWSDAKLASYLREGHQRGEAVGGGTHGRGGERRYPSSERCGPRRPDRLSADPAGAARSGAGAGRGAAARRNRAAYRCRGGKRGLAAIRLRQLSCPGRPGGRLVPTRAPSATIRRCAIPRGPTWCASCSTASIARGGPSTPSCQPIGTCSAISNWPIWPPTSAAALVATRPTSVLRTWRRARRREIAVAAIELKVNGEQRQLDVDPRMPLLEALRDELGLKGPKFGCGLGECGACTVLADGKPVRACLLPQSPLPVASC